MALDRRGFLMFLAGGAAGSVLTPTAWKLTDDISIWTQNWPWIPRIPAGALDVKPSLLKLGAAEYGIRINRVNTQPVTASGNPEHPLSLGGIDPLGAASVQLLYSPSRVSGPLLKDEQGGFKSVSWTKATELLLDMLKPLKGRSDALACLSGDLTGSTPEILSKFLRAMGSSNLYFQSADGLTLNRVWKDLMQGQGQIGFDQEKSDLLLALEPDLLESWGTPVKNQKLFGRGTTELIYAGAMQNNTATVARSWLPIHPGASGHLALALAYHLLQSGRQPHSTPRGFKAFREYVLSRYTPEQAERKTGASAAAVRNLAKKLQHAERPLVISGSTTGTGAPGFPFFAGCALNLLLNRINTPGGLTCLPDPVCILASSGSEDPVPGRDICDYIQDCARGGSKIPEVFFVHEANPRYALPGSRETSDFFDTIPFTVSFSQFMDETAARSDLILPNPYFLERLDDSFTPFGSAENNYSLAQPVIEPLTGSKPTSELFIDLARKLDVHLGIQSYAELLRKKARRLGAEWDRLITGQAWTSGTTLAQPRLTVWDQRIEAMCRDHPGTESDIPSLVLENNLKTGSPQTGLPPFGLKALLEEELSEGLAAVRINQQTASRLNVRAGQRVTLTTRAGSIQARILLDEGVVPNAIAVPTGFGHTHWDMFSRDKGGNANILLSLAGEAGSGLCYGAAVEARLK